MKTKRLRPGKHKRVDPSSTPFFFGKNAHEADLADPFFRSAKALVSPSILQRQPEHPATLPTLRYGARGVKVYYLQKRLHAHGAHLAIDGIFGPETYQAVRRFQALYAPPVDGIVGPITWKALTSPPEANPKDEDDAAVSPEDLYVTGRNILAVNETLEQGDPVAHALFGSILQQTGTTFLHAATPPLTAKSLFVPVGFTNTTALTVTSR